MPVTTYTTIQGEIVSENRNGVKRDYVPDPLGNTVALLDANQQKTDTFSYWPYGELKSRTGTTPTPMQYVGTRGYYRSAAQGYYVRARTLDSFYGRWTTNDPVLWTSGHNRYTYVRNNPVSAVDPTGLIVPFAVVLVAIFVVGGIMCANSLPPPPPDPEPDYAMYGNYCGVENRTRPPNVKPVSAVDNCCRVHDADYVASNCHWPTSYFRARCRWADIKFCGCLVRASCNWDPACIAARAAAVAMFCPKYAQRV